MGKSHLLNGALSWVDSCGVPVISLSPAAWTGIVWRQSSATACWRSACFASSPLSPCLWWWNFLVFLPSMVFGGRAVTSPVVVFAGHFTGSLDPAPFSQNGQKVLFPYPAASAAPWHPPDSLRSSDGISSVPFGLSPTEKPKYAQRQEHLQLPNPLDNPWVKARLLPGWRWDGRSWTNSNGENFFLVLKLDGLILGC